MTYTLQHTIQARTLTAYDSFNPVHEALLLQLWDVLMPHTSLEHRISHQWTEIGFQGDDPATDFRGMGMQGLDDLVYFAQTYPQVAKRVLGNASHGIGWYPFAIAGIHTTRFAVELMKNHQLQWFLYRHDVQTGYSEFYCSVFSMFDTFWTTHAPPLTVMDFEVAFKRFKTKVEVELWFDLLLPLEKERVVVDSIRDTVTVTTTAHPTLTQRKPIFL
ncbi:ELMO/CED-12 family-domain-containing protein [Spinellus fusiger]|nr:ELMO/CED-12 family-domain-containing protein [Spinellus fusiger]